MIEQNELLLPRLRSDIELRQDAPGQNGAPMWLIHDPLQHRYFQIDESTLNLISLWQAGLSPGQMVERAASEQGLNVDEQQIIKLVAFLRSGNLTHEDDSGNWRDLAQRAAAAKKSPLQQLTYKHLFFKLPLIRPQRMLEATQHIVAPLYTKTFAVILLICGLSGLYLVSRQWDQFLGTFSMLFSFEGILYFLLSLVILKISHELGHAYTAVRFGSRVASMGVAFMLMTPLLYTDVSDAWRLSSRKKRMIISAAGMAVELALALIATLLWAFLPDGALRSIVFMIATTGWVMSLAFNLNPLLKFDGYYLFSDFLGIDNLQSRAFALGRWKLRRVLFAPHLPPSEQFSPRLQNGLILYALITWLYRLAIFTAIALFVYTFTFKLLGLFLFALEIWLLVLHPVWREIRSWPEVNTEFISRRRIGISASLVAAFVLVFIVPWSTRIEIPAVLVASDLAYIYPPRAAEVISISAERGKTVSKGSPLLRLQEPEIDSQIAGTRVRRDLTRVRLSQVMADRTELDQLLVLSQELNSQQSRLDGLASQKQEMVVRAPIKGRLLQLATDLHPGRWVGKGDLLAIIASGDKHQVKGYVSGDHLQRLSEDARGRFIPEDLGRAAFAVKLTRIAGAGSRNIDIAELASIHGGKIAVEAYGDDILAPVGAQYLVELQPQGALQPPNQIIRGMVHIEGKRQSLLAQIWRQISKVLVRESGF